MLRWLDHLEEWLITFLMGAATLLIFVAVVHRYAAGLAIPGVQDFLIRIDLSWAQELCIYMSCGWPSSARHTACARASTSASTWLINRLAAAGTHRQYVLFGLAGRRDCSPASSATLGAVIRLGYRAHRSRSSPDLEVPKWIVYLVHSASPRT